MPRRAYAVLCSSLLLSFLVPAPARAADRFVIDPEPGTIVTIEGIYPQPDADVCDFKRRSPLVAKYRGRLEIERGSDGELRIINQLSFSEYLRGLAEVPLSWPEAALRAQIIAARSYALDAYERGRSGAGARGYHICATDQCQVYRGATIELGAFGERWRAAVRDTEGKVLRYAGRVIQAFYFSTSDGTTRRSFPGGTPQPWLPGVDGEDDDSPLARWTAPVRLAHVAGVLRARGSWSGDDFTRAQDEGDSVLLRSPGGSLTMSKRDLRIALNAEAPCVYPGVYPNPTGSQTGGRLPQTVPSSSYTVRTQGARAVFTGSGWGHFVGMSQWGAKSLADRGRNARQILKHYYGPATIETVEEPPSLRVLAAEGMQRVRIGIDGPATVSAGASLAPTDAFEVRGGDRLRVLRGIGPELRGILDVQPKATRLRAEAGDVKRLRVEFSRPARVTLVLRGGGGEHELISDASYDRGVSPLVLTIPEGLSSGEYVAVIRAYDGLDRARATVPVLVGAEAAPDGPVPASDSGAPWFIVAIAAFLAVALIGARVVISRR